MPYPKTRSPGSCVELGHTAQYHEIREFFRVWNSGYFLNGRCKFYISFINHDKDIAVCTEGKQCTHFIFSKMAEEVGLFGLQRIRNHIRLTKSGKDLLHLIQNLPLPEDDNSPVYFRRRKFSGVFRIGWTKNPEAALSVLVFNQK